jgi:heptaprenylglyceryl phosphate synthase
MILTDTGSNPQAQGFGPIPNEMIRAVKSMIDVPYIVGGGVRTPRELGEVYRSGADIVQIGTAFEDSGNAVYKKAVAFAKVTKEEGARKLKKQ